MYSTYTKENSMFKVLKCFDMLTLRLKEGLKDVYFSYILILLKLLYELPNLFLLNSSILVITIVRDDACFNI